MVKYKLSEPAEDDLRELYRYGVLTFGLDIANEYYDCLVLRFEEITEHPKLYQTVDDIRPGYRRSVCDSVSRPKMLTPIRRRLAEEKLESVVLRLYDKNADF